MEKDRSNEELQQTFAQIDKHINWEQFLALMRIQIIALKSQQTLFKLNLQELPSQRDTLVLTLIFGFVALVSIGISLITLGIAHSSMWIEIIGGVLCFLVFGGLIYLSKKMYKSVGTAKKVIGDMLKVTDVQLESLNDITSDIVRKDLETKQETQELLEKARRQLKGKKELPEKET